MTTLLPAFADRWCSVLQTHEDEDVLQVAVANVADGERREFGDVEHLVADARDGRTDVVVDGVVADDLARLIRTEHHAAIRVLERHQVSRHRPSSLLRVQAVLQLLK